MFYEILTNTYFNLPIKLIKVDGEKKIVRLYDKSHDPGWLSTRVDKKPVVQSWSQTSKNSVTSGPISEPVHGSTGRVNPGFKTSGEPKKVGFNISLHTNNVFKKLGQISEILSQ